MAGSKRNTGRKDANGRIIWAGPRGGLFVLVGGKRKKPSQGSFPLNKLPNTLYPGILKHLNNKNVASIQRTSKNLSKSQAIANNMKQRLDHLPHKLFRRRVQNMHRQVERNLFMNGMLRAYRSQLNPYYEPTECTRSHLSPPGTPRC